MCWNGVSYKKQFWIPPVRIFQAAWALLWMTYDGWNQKEEYYGMCGQLTQKEQ